MAASTCGIAHALRGELLHHARAHRAGIQPMALASEADAFGLFQASPLRECYQFESNWLWRPSGATALGVGLPD
jgi:hypothetical protein